VSKEKNLIIIYFSASPSKHALGPAITIDNFISNMSELVNIELISLNMDYSAKRRLFSGFTEIVESGGCRITYLTPGFPALKYLFQLLRKRNSIVLINCLYDYRLAIPSLVFSLLYPPRLLLHMPHGIFMDIIQAKNRARKYFFNRMLGSGVVSRRVVHVVSSVKEKEDAIKVLGPDIDTVVIPHFAVNSVNTPHWYASKTANSLRIVLIGRVVEQKNIVYALDRIAEAGVACTLDIFGEIADSGYMRQCARALEIGGLKNHVKFYGRRDQNELLKELGDYDLMFLPTKGENFGQAIIEAMSAGLPVLISDRTPWSDVGRYDAGWAVPLSEPQEFSAKIRSAYEASGNWGLKRKSAVQYVEMKIQSQRIKSDWIKLINEGIPTTASAPNEGERWWR